MTYSIVARDKDTGWLGVAVQSHWFGVGRIVPHGRPGVGVVAVQANGDIGLGPRALDLLESGLSAPAVVEHLRQDAREAVTQIAVVDADGAVGTHTGARCFIEASHVTGVGWTAQANLMAKRSVPEAMGTAYENEPDDFPTRLLAALAGAEKLGGDLRGQQSAAMLIVSGSSSDSLGGWDDVIVDVRVDDDEQPLLELVRLARVARAYREHELGTALFETAPTQASEHWERAADLAPDNPELRFWRAIALAEGGDIAEARSELRRALAISEVWWELLKRLSSSGLEGESTGIGQLLAGGRPEPAAR